MQKTQTTSPSSQGWASGVCYSECVHDIALHPLVINTSSVGGQYEVSRSNTVLSTTNRSTDIRHRPQHVFAIPTFTHSRGSSLQSFPVLPSSILSPERPVRSNLDAKGTEESVLIREVAYLERKGIPF